MYKFYKILQISQILLSRREKRIFHILFRSENYYFQKISEFVREEFPRILEPSRDETTPLFSRDNRSKEFPSSFPMDRREIFRLPRNETACWNNYLRHRERYIYIYVFLSLYFSPTRIAKEGEEGGGVAFSRLESGPWIHSVGFCATRRFSNPLLLFLHSPSPPLLLRQASQPVIDST